MCFGLFSIIQLYHGHLSITRTFVEKFSKSFRKKIKRVSLDVLQYLTLVLNVDYPYNKKKNVNKRRQCYAYLSV